MSDISFLGVQVHYNGIFIPKPLLYFDPQKTLIQNVDFKGFGYSEFISFLHDITKTKCRNVYYCLPHENLSEGLGVIQNEGDYREFIECGDGNTEKRIDVYLDHFNEPLFDWIEMEDPDEVEDDACHAEEEEESRFSDANKLEHEEYEVVSELKPLDDPFLNELCTEKKKKDETEEEVDVQPVYHVHDPRQQWDKMVPVLGMKFSDPDQLKELLSNYVVKHGYNLWYEKTDKNRILAKCGKCTTHRCPFRLWATWMKTKHSLQIKSLTEEHNCSRTFKLGSIVSYKWIGKHFIKEIIERPKMSLRKMKAQISEKFNITVSLGQCRNARKFALNEIEGSLVKHYGRLWDYGEEIRRSNLGM